jgi:outer membrane lipoprotein-sorting protein
MSCTPTELLAHGVIEQSAAAAHQAHLAECPVCRRKVEDLRLLGDALVRAHRHFDFEHEQSKARLLAALPDARRPIHSPGLGYQVIHWLGGLTMAQRTVFGGVGIVTLLILVVFWAGTTSPRARAMDNMAQKVREAKSFEMMVDIELRHLDELGRPQIDKDTMKWYWQAPRSQRWEQVGQLKPKYGKTTTIHPAGKPGIEMNDTSRQYRRLRAEHGQISPLMMVDALGRYSGQADRDLGTKQFNGKTARGFEIDARKIDDSARFVGPVEVWLDAETELPVQVRFQVNVNPTGTVTMRDFRWNVDLDPALFDTTPPPGYVDATPKPFPLEEQVHEITVALANYRELMGGHYPQTKTIYGDVVRDEMLASFGVKDGRPTPAQARSEQYVKVRKAGLGFAMLNELFRENADFAYYGLSVGPADTNKILVRWQLEDGRVQVIFGDLHHEVMTAERARELESR